VDGQAYNPCDVSFCSFFSSLLYISTPNYYFSFFFFIIIIIIIINSKGRDSAVGTATGYGLNGRAVEVRVTVRSRISLLHVVQTGSRAQPASYSMSIGGSSSGGEVAKAR
jgi:hypothetical protein